MFINVLTMSCTAEQIAEKRREAQERLRLRQEQQKSSNHAAVSVNNNNTIKPASVSGVAEGKINAFYGSSTANKTAELQNYEAKIKSQQPYKNKNRILSQPYPKKDAKAAVASTKAPETKLAPVFQKTVTCTCAMVASTRFNVIVDGYNVPLIDVFKTIPTRSYGE